MASRAQELSVVVEMPSLGMKITPAAGDIQPNYLKEKQKLFQGKN